jgi:nitroreductase
MIRKINNIVQRILAVKTIRSILNSLIRIHYGIWSINRFSASIYFLIAGAFSREERAVMKGILKYYNGLSKHKNAEPLLRRNIHRIEKGLIMRPQKPVFAKNYIVATSEAYKVFMYEYSNNMSLSDSNTVQWFYSVLSQYFAIVGEDKTVDTARAIFNSANHPNIGEVKTPLVRSQFNEKIISYEELFNLTQKRHSVRWFKNEKINHDLIDKALNIAKTAPSACNRLPYEYRFFDEPELVKKIASIPMGTAGFSDNIPVLCVLIGRLDYYFSERDRHVPYIDASLSVMQFMLALETLGLASCVINWPDFSFLESKMSRTLKLKPYERPILLLALGYPDENGKIPSSLKKETKFLRSWNTI